MRKTKIICTIGPVSESEEKLKELLLAGMNVARFNFSHGNHEEHQIKLERARKAAKELGLPLATMQDTKGPEIRLRDFEGGKVFLETGAMFRLTTEEVMGTADRATITYKNLKKDVEIGKSILIDDGLIELTIKAIEDTDIVCEVVNGGYVSNHKGINVPGVILSMPYISEVDKDDIIFGVKMGYDYLAASFVRCADDVLAVKELIKEHGGRMKVISKIENMQGIDNLDEILEASDGIMVARGDMGVEIPLEEVPVLQKKMIKKALQLGKIVITATQMLDSMIKNPRPTRAETTDVANAIYDGTSAIMLSGETAAGRYPVEALQTMMRIATRTEQDIDYRKRFFGYDHKASTNITDAICHATCTTAHDLNASAILTVTKTGTSARMISRYRPGCQIIGCTIDEKVGRQLNLSWGVRPLLIMEENDVIELFNHSVSNARDYGFLNPGELVVITSGVPLGMAGTTNMIKVQTVQEPRKIATW